MSNFKERVIAETKSLFTNSISFCDYEIIHNVNVNDKLIAYGGNINYEGNEEEFNIKSARLMRKKDEDGGHKYVLKIIVE